MPDVMRSSEGEQLVRRVERSILWRGLFATMTTVTPLWTGGWIAVDDVLAPGSRGSFAFWFTVGPATSCTIGLAIFAVAVRWIFRKATLPYLHGREATREERRVVPGLAWRMTVFATPVWLIAIAILLPATRSVRFTIGSIVPLGFLGFVIAGTVSLAFAYVLIDDALRPIYAMALADPAISSDRPVGLLQRFGLYWLVGSGLNLFSTALVLIVLPDSGRRIAILFCIFGAIVGGGLTILAARSVTGRVEGLLASVERVEGGDLGTAATVDDLGEIGRLQRGFNRMVVGLRERERLGDLFGRHVGGDVARRALEGSGLEGSERTVSVLFVDVIGSTSLATDRPAAEVVLMLNGLFDAVVRAVDAEGGLVSQFQGDGALCIFGAPIDAPDHAERALRATRVLSRNIAELRAAFPGFDAAIGVSTGDVVAGDIGNTDRYQYTVIGDPVNEASRLCDEAKARDARVLASGSSVAAASADGWVGCGELLLRGRPGPTAVYEPG